MYEDHARRIEILAESGQIAHHKRKSTMWDDYVAPALLVGAVMFLVGLWCGMTIVQMGLGV